MTVFKDYSAYYDLLYRDKDYAKECDFILSEISVFKKEPGSLLNLGCGTGSHDIYFSEKGWDVTGVDFSSDMIIVANEKCGDKVKFINSDVRSLKTNGKYDVVCALFHVLSYMQSNQDVMDFFSTIKNHLKNDGIFIFDCWYGPTVLTERPERRYKVLESETTQIERHCTPNINLEQNTVEVNYDIIGKRKIDSSIFEFSEKHIMRYFFFPELQYFTENIGLKIFQNKEWLSSKPLNDHTFSAFFIGGNI